MYSQPGEHDKHCFGEAKVAWEAPEIYQEFLTARASRPAELVARRTLCINPVVRPGQKLGY